MILTQKTRIFPDEGQERVLWALSEHCRLAYNFALTERKECWESNKGKPKGDRRHVTYADQQNSLPGIKRKYPEYGWVYSKVLQMVLRKLDADFRSFFALWKNGDSSARPPKYKPKSRFVPLCYNQSGFKVAGDSIRFSHRHPSGVELAFSLGVPLKGTNIKQVELFSDYRGRWFVSMHYEADEPAYVDNGLYQAIDLGIKNLVTAVNLHGKFVQAFSFCHLNMAKAGLSGA